MSLAHGLRLSGCSSAAKEQSSYLRQGTQFSVICGSLVEERVDSMLCEGNHEGARGDGREAAAMKSAAPKALFVISLWLEPTPMQHKPEWRWRVVMVQSGEERYFHRLGDLLAYVGAIAGVPPPG